MKLNTGGNMINFRTGRAPIAAIAALAAAGLGGGAALAAPAAPAVTVPVPCSAAALTTAVSTAPSGTTLSLAPYCKYFILSGLSTTHDIDIDGNGATIEPGVPVNNFTLLMINGATVQISDLSFANSDQSTTIGFPGAIQNNGGTLTLIRCTFTGNTGRNAGAVGNSNADLSVFNSKFTDNTATSPSTGGGAISGAGSQIDIVASSFFTNTDSSPAGRGGAIRVDTGMLNVTGSTFRGNTADIGGAIYNTATFTLRTSTFTANSATDEVGGIGGAVFSSSPDGLLSTSTFKANTASDAGGAIGTNGTQTVAGNTIDSNSTPGIGGGIDNLGTLTLTGNKILRNKASSGGGLFNETTGSVTLIANLFTGNTPQNCVPTLTGC